MRQLIALVLLLLLCSRDEALNRSPRQKQSGAPLKNNAPVKPKKEAKQFGGMLDFLKSDVPYQDFDNDVGDNDPLKRLARGQDAKPSAPSTSKENPSPAPGGGEARPVVGKRAGSVSRAPPKQIKAETVKAPAPAPVKKPEVKKTAPVVAAKKVPPARVTPVKIAPKAVSPSCSR